MPASNDNTPTIPTNQPGDGPVTRLLIVARGQQRMLKHSGMTALTRVWDAAETQPDVPPELPILVQQYVHDRLKALMAGSAVTALTAIEPHTHEAVCAFFDDAIAAARSEGL